MRPRVLRFTTFVAAAFVALLGAHALDYAVLARDPAVRMRLLAESGHQWLSRAPEFALAALVIAALAAVATGVRGTPAATSPLRLALLLSLVQSGAFVALEAGERLAVGARADRLILVTAVGVALQVVTAFVASFVIALLQRAGRVLAAVLRSSRAPRRAPLVRRAPRAQAQARARFMGSLIFGRAPPLFGR